MSKNTTTTIALLALAGAGFWYASKKTRDKPSAKSAGNLMKLNSPEEVHEFWMFYRAIEETPPTTMDSDGGIVVAIGIGYMTIEPFARANPETMVVYFSRDLFNESKGAKEAGIFIDSQSWGISGMPVVGARAFDSEGEIMPKPINPDIIEMVFAYTRTGEIVEGSEQLAEDTGFTGEGLKL